MKKYETLVKILDEIRNNAESNADFYLPQNGKTTLINARSRAFIQFFLKSYFGILDFNEREKFITDDSMDGGIDAYYIDDSEKNIYLIQTKFRDNAKNYINAKIKNKDLFKMDLKRIINKGEKKDENGVSYNKKILNLQKRLSKIKNISTYKYVVLVVANLTPSQKKYIIKSHFPERFDIEIFDYSKVYNQLLFSYVRDDFFNGNTLSLKINLSNKYNKKPINYKVKTEYGDCYVYMVFVPTEEIAKAMYKYRNSILEYNPRTYLGMQKNGVNKEIENSILKKKTNDFVLLNNGITILSTKVTNTISTGQKNKGEITIINPQIINGGQTSFALSDIYESFLNRKIKKNPFKGKEVLLKVIEQEKIDKYEKITSSVSLATNNQSAITPGDLKSNHESQVELQKYIFEKFGFYYERKKGEFLNSSKKSYIKKNRIIKRIDFLRTAYSSSFPTITKNPKNISEKIIFSDSIFKVISEKDKYKKYVLSYFVYTEVKKIKSKGRISTDKWFMGKYGNALRYGDLAVTMVVTYILNKTDWKRNEIPTEIKKILLSWKDFEKKSFAKKSNSIYFNSVTRENNSIGYYKGDTLIKDLIEYFNCF